MALLNSQGQIMLSNVKGANKVHVVLTTNFGNVQLYNNETKQYLPDFTANNLVVTAKVYVTADYSGNNPVEQITAGRVTNMKIARSVMNDNASTFSAATEYSYTTAGYKEAANMTTYKAIKYEFRGKLADTHNSTSQIDVYGALIIRKTKTQGILSAICYAPNGSVFDQTPGHKNPPTTLPAVCDVYRGGVKYTSVSYQWQKYIQSDHGTQVIDLTKIAQNPTLNPSDTKAATLTASTFTSLIINSWALGFLYAGSEWKFSAGLKNTSAANRSIFLTGLYENERIKITFTGTMTGMAGCTVTNTNGDTVTKLVSGTEYIIKTGNALELGFAANAVITQISRIGMPYFVNIAGQTTNTLNVTPDMVDDFQFFRCKCTDNSDSSNIAYGIVDFLDQTDPYKVVITSKTGDKILNGSGSTILVATVYQDGVEIDTGFTYNWYKYDSNGAASNWSGTSSNLKTTSVNTLTVPAADVVSSVLITCRANKI